MALRSVDDYISRIANGYMDVVQFYNDHAAGTVVVGSNAQGLTTSAASITIPTLQTGVTAYRLVGGLLSCAVTQVPYMLARRIDFGSLDISTNVWTSGGAMPTVTEGNASHNTWSPVFIEVVSALNATPGSIAITYVDQDGNTSESTSATAMTASAAAGAANWFYMLNGTDKGVRSISSAVRTSGTTPTGTVAFFGVRPFAMFFNQGAAYSPYVLNFLTKDFPPPTFQAGEKIVCYPVSGQTQAAKSIMGQLMFVGDN